LSFYRHYYFNIKIVNIKKMKKKIINCIALTFIMIIVVINITVVSTKDNASSISLKNIEAKACDILEYPGYVSPAENNWCYANGGWHRSCRDADSVCTIP
jgi:hypothetical protein